MKKNINLIVTLFFIGSIFSQKTISGKVTYNYDIIEVSSTDKKVPQNVVNDFNRSLKENKDKIIFSLTFNNSKSNYRISQKKMNLDKNQLLNYAKIITGADEDIFVDLENKESFKKLDFFGEYYIIKKTLDDIWILTQETKTINEYTCYKAFLKNKRQNSPLVFAWYTPKIPVNFGPKGYGNLPGLILELTIGPIVYYATKIELNPSDMIEINKPTKGKLMSEEEFENLLKNFDKNHK